AAGWGLYYVLIPRLSRSDDPELMSFLMFFGVSIAAAAGMLLVFGADSGSVPVGPIYVSTARLVALAIAIVISGVLALFLFYTLPGKALRAAIMNPEAIQIMGVDIVR